MPENHEEEIKAMQRKIHAFARELENRIKEFRKDTGIPIVVQVGEPESRALGEPLTQQVRVAIYVD